jgi:hypothetical protein
LLSKHTTFIEGGLLSKEFFLVFQQDCGYSSSVRIFDGIKSLMIEERCPLFLQLFRLEHLLLKG